MDLVQVEFIGVGSRFEYATLFSVKSLPDLSRLLQTASRSCSTPISLVDLWSGYVKRASHLDAERNPWSSRGYLIITLLRSPTRTQAAFQPTAHGRIWEVARGPQVLDQPRWEVGVLVVYEAVSSLWLVGGIFIKTSVRSP